MTIHSLLIAGSGKYAPRLSPSPSPVQSLRSVRASRKQRTRMNRPTKETVRQIKPLAGTEALPITTSMESRRPEELDGTQLAAYGEGYAAAPTWAFIGEAFQASSLHAELQEAFSEASTTVWQRTPRTNRPPYVEFLLVRAATNGSYVP